MINKQGSRKPRRTTTLYIRDVPRDIHDMFKLLMLKNGMCIRTGVISLLRYSIVEEPLDKIRTYKKAAEHGWTGHGPPLSKKTQKLERKKQLKLLPRVPKFKLDEEE